MTGVQTCALPIYAERGGGYEGLNSIHRVGGSPSYLMLRVRSGWVTLFEQIFQCRDVEDAVAEGLDAVDG